MMIPSLEEFKRLADQGNLIPVFGGGALRLGDPHFGLPEDR